MTRNPKFEVCIFIKVEVRGRGIKLFTPYQSHYIHIVVASWCKGIRQSLAERACALH